MALKSTNEIKRFDAAGTWRHLAETDCVGPEEELPHRTLHMDERQRRLEWFTFVTHDKKAKFEIDLERRVEYR